MPILKNKIAVITGASRGFGVAIARAFAREGALLVLGARSQDAIDRLVKELEAQGCRAAGMVCDVTDTAQVEALACLAEERFGRIDIWVNNAGVSPAYGPTPDVAPEAFIQTCQVNIFGTYFGSMTAMKRFRKQGSGKLINMLGAGSDRPAPFQNAYGSSKVWIRWFSTCLAAETKGSGVDVLMLQPGIMFTEMITRVEAVQGYGEKVKVLETVARILGNPPEFSAEKAVWLASSATDGRSGLRASAPTTLGMLKGLLRELWLRLTGKLPPDRLTIHEVPKYQ
jgi:NAD(P)-dependent dehydrogenase (short-subunit alcohol dehydrogenase family)